jgi:hypothetical protein
LSPMEKEKMATLCFFDRKIGMKSLNFSLISNLDFRKKVFLVLNIKCVTYKVFIESQTVLKIRLLKYFYFQNDNPKILFFLLFHPSSKVRVSLERCKSKIKLVAA